MKHHYDLEYQTLHAEITGDITSTTAPTLRKDLFDLLDHELANTSANWRTLRLDLTSAKMVDSVGLNLLVAVIRRVKENQRQVSCVISSTHVHRTMKFTRLDTMMQIEMPAPSVRE